MDGHGLPVEKQCFFFFDVFREGDKLKKPNLTENLTASYQAFDGEDMHINRICGNLEVGQPLEMIETCSIFVHEFYWQIRLRS